MGCPVRVAQWRAVYIQLLPPLGHTRGQKHRGLVGPLLAQQGGRDPGGPPRHDCLWHRGPPPHKGPEVGPSPGLPDMVCG